MFRHVRVSLVLAVLALSSPAGAATITLSQAGLLAAEEVTILFGGNGRVLSRVADGGGVLGAPGPSSTRTCRG
jgi:hypothetical protein